MRNLTIKDLENFSGIKAHTIRMWEQRYHLLTPLRTDTNFRYYSLEDLKRLLQIALLNEFGFKISALAKMSRAEIEKQISFSTIDRSRQMQSVHHLLISMINNDLEEFEAILDNSLLCWQEEITINKVILPFLERAGIMSYQQKTNEVHMAVTAVRKKLILGIERANPGFKVNKTALLFLQEGEHYDLVLLYMTLMLKKIGIKVLYLGTNISLNNLKMFVREKTPDFLFTYLPPKQILKLGDLPEYIHQMLPHSSLIIGVSDKTNVLPEKSNNVIFMHYADVVNVAQA
jgi:DNA-binding transcriptional MerR regulator